MSNQDIQEMLASGALVETLQVKMSALDEIEYAAACEVMRVKPSTNARNLMITFVRKVQSEHASEFQLKVAGARDDFIARKKALAKKHEAKLVEPRATKKKAK